MPLQTFRYAVCGGSNTLLGLLVYYVGFHYIFDKENFDAGFIVLKPHNASLFLSSGLSFFVGFILNKFVVFADSYLKGRIQLFRYFLSFLVNLTINYFVLKLLVQFFYMEPVLSQVLTTILIIAIGYVTQKHFTFKMSGETVQDTGLK